MSSGSSVNEALTGYAAGRVTAEQLAGVVAAAYYGNGAQGLGPGGRLKPLMEMIERAHPGVVELSGSAEKPGFGVRLAEPALYSVYRRVRKLWRKQLRRRSERARRTCAW